MTEITKQLGTAADLATGKGLVTQTRGDSSLVLPAVDIAIPVDSVLKLSALDATVYTSARLYYSAVDFVLVNFDATNSTGLAPDVPVGTGSWIAAKANPEVSRANKVRAPLHGGVWKAGVEFEFSYQYMVYEGVALTPKAGTPLPYLVGATPNFSDVDVVEDELPAEQVTFNDTAAVGITADNVQAAIESLDVDVLLNAIAIGNNATAIGNNATAIGNNATAIAAMGVPIFTVHTTSNPTWEPNENTKAIMFVAVGGGAPGVGVNHAGTVGTASVGAGGMSGAVCEKYTATVASSYALVVGTAGVGATAGVGTAGTVSTVVGTGISLSAPGGAVGGNANDKVDYVNRGQAAGIPATGGDINIGTSVVDRVVVVGGVPVALPISGSNKHCGSQPCNDNSSGRDNNLGFGGGGGGTFAEFAVAAQLKGGDGAPGAIITMEYK